MTKLGLLNKVYDCMNSDCIELMKLFDSIDESKIDVNDFNDLLDCMDSLNEALDSIRFYAKDFDWKGALK